MKIKYSIILTCFIGIIVLFFPLISRGAPVCQGNCVPDGCNQKCPDGCTSTQDPDCGCQLNDGCCGIGCDSVSDNPDCSDSVCTPKNKCSTSRSGPWYCNGSGILEENSGECGCSNGWVPGPNKTYCLACVEDWSCADWSACVNSKQTRTCDDANSCVAAVNKPGLGQSCDSTQPVVTAFTLPPTASSLTVSFTVVATDAFGVTGYLITDSLTTPLANADGWIGTAPTSYTFGTPGSKTLYVWAKDLAGNVSIGIRRDVTITLPVVDITAPVVTFTLPSTASSRTVSFTVSAFDAVGVTSYLITESSDIPPLSADWIGTAPTPGTFTATGQKIFTADGSKTLYVWAKDAAGNVSLIKSASVIVDATAPVVTSFTAAANQALVNVSWVVTDSGGSHLDRVEVWRAPDTGATPAWQEITSLKQTITNQNLDSYNHSVTDNPGVGAWLYGIHVLDQVGNEGKEPNTIKLTIAAACPPESDAKFCSNLGKNCGSVTADNNCLVSHTVADCSLGAGCVSPKTCGIDNICACIPDSDAKFCSNLGKNCGSVTADNNCLVSHTVADCSLGAGCVSPKTCGIDNVCACSPVCPLPSEVCAGVTDTRANGCNNGNCSVDGIKTGCPDIVVLNPTDDETLLAGSSLTFRVFINPLISAKIVNIKTGIQIIVRRLKVGTKGKTGMDWNDSQVFSADLYDDGNHGDGAKNDNIWGATWQPIEEPTASGLTDSFAYHYAYILGYNQNPSSILRWFKIAAKPACIAVLNPGETDNGDSSQRIDIVYLSADDGDLDHQKDNSDFAADALSFKNKLLEYAPFSANENKFNFWRVNTSMNCTVGQKSIDGGKTFIYDAGCTQCIVCPSVLAQIAASGCPHDTIEVIVNSTTYGGQTRAGYATSYNGPGGYYAPFKKIVNSGSVTGVHELGHDFGKLLDEYTYPGSSYPVYCCGLDGNKDGDISHPSEGDVAQSTSLDWLFACNGFQCGDCKKTRLPSGATCPISTKVNPSIDLAPSRNCKIDGSVFSDNCSGLGAAYCQGCTFPEWVRQASSTKTVMNQGGGVFTSVDIERLNKMIELLTK